MSMKKKCGIAYIEYQDTMVPVKDSLRSPKIVIKAGSRPKNADLKEIECFKCHNKGHYANTCPKIKEKDGKMCSRFVS